MAESEKLQQLDRKIAQSVVEALSGLRGDISERMREHADAVEEKLQALEQILPTQFVAPEDIEPWAQAAANSARTSAFEELRGALSAIDGARTQADILSTLLERVGGFCSRTALFLTRSTEVRGWGAYGFAENGPSPSDLSFEYDEGSPWRRLASGDGSIELSAADCAPLCSHLESAVPQEAVLVPIVLGDRLAAALYADRVDDIDDEGELDLAALQCLAFVSAQAIETLAFRRRSHTSTLAVAGEGSGVSLPLWGAETSTSTDEPAVAQPETAPETPEPAPTEESIEDVEELEFTVEESEPTLEERATDVTPSQWLDRDQGQRETEELTPGDLDQVRESMLEVDEDPVVSTTETVLSDEGEVLPELEAPLLEVPGLDADLVTEEIQISPPEEIITDVSTAFDQGTAEIPSADELVVDEPAAVGQDEISAPEAVFDAIDVSEDETILMQMPKAGAPTPPSVSAPEPSAEPSAPPSSTAPYRAPDDTLSGTGTGVRRRYHHRVMLTAPVWPFARQAPASRRRRTRPTMRVGDWRAC